jgi:hypothetical protein
MAHSDTRMARLVPSDTRMVHSDTRMAHSDTRMASGGFHHLLREDGGATVHAFRKFPEFCQKIISTESSSNGDYRSINI